MSLAITHQRVRHLRRAAMAPVTSLLRLQQRLLLLLLLQLVVHGLSNRLWSDIIEHPIKCKLRNRKAMIINDYQKLPTSWS